MLPWGAGDYDGPIWIEAFAEGERWTPIPRPGDLERVAEQLADAAGAEARARQIESCTKSGCIFDRCADRAEDDAARNEYAFCVAQGLEFTRRRACPMPA